MRKDFESRFMPDVKFLIPEDALKNGLLLDILYTSTPFVYNSPVPVGAITSSDGFMISAVCNSTVSYKDFDNCKEVSIYEAIPELVPDGMRYNKELDKLVPDVIEIPSVDEAIKAGILGKSIPIEHALTYNSKDTIKKLYQVWTTNHLFTGGNINNAFQNFINEVSDSIEDKKSIANEYYVANDSLNDLQHILQSDMKYGDKLRAIRNTDIEVKEQITPHYYGETCLCGRKIDWYVIGDLYRKDKGSAWDHAGKKLLRAGEGHKTLKEDIKEVINSLSRWLEQIEDKEKTNVK